MNKQKSFFESKQNVVLTAIFYTFLWGSAFPLVKICMDTFSIANDDNMSKCLVAGIRFAFSGLFTLIWCYFTEPTKLKVDKAQRGNVILYALLATTMQYAFTYIGLSRIDGSKGAIFDQLCVFLIVLFGGMFFKDDKLNIKKVVGCILGFAGVLIINTDGISFEFTLSGEGIMLLAVLCQTIAYFIAKNSSEGISAAKLVGYGQAIGGITLCVFAYLSGGRVGGVNTAAILSLAGLIFISAFAYVLSLMPLKYFPASEISSFNLLITVFGVVMSGLVLGENILKWNYFISLALIGTGIIFINSRRK